MKKKKILSLLLASVMIGQTFSMELTVGNRQSGLMNGLGGKD